MRARAGAVDAGSHFGRELNFGWRDDRSPTAAAFGGGVGLVSRSGGKISVSCLLSRSSSIANVDVEIAFLGIVLYMDGAEAFDLFDRALFISCFYSDYGMAGRYCGCYSSRWPVGTRKTRGSM